MLLKRVRVQNFRACRDATLEFGSHTAILGGNGAGKSTVLRAIDKFYSPSSNIDPDDFFGRRFDSPIEITLTFSDFNQDEIERFGSRIQSDEMTVTRVFEAGGGKSNGRYFGSTLQQPAFVEVRAIANGVERRRRFNELAGGFGLQQAKNAGEMDDQMAAWEAGNPGKCTLFRDDGQFFGFANVGRGSLQKSTSFVFIPAVRDASADSVDARGAVIARLLELVVKSAMQRRRDVRQFQVRVSEEYRELVDPAHVPELDGLADGLTATLQDFYAEAGVTLRWRPAEDFAIPLPAADVLLAEDGFEGPVDKKGHGLQRAFIVTLLQHLAKAGSADANASESEASHNLEGDNDAPVQEKDELEKDVVAYRLPGLILAIEEPELYQHPTKQRHFAKVLKQLSDGSLAGVATQTQVMFASHSPLFVSLDRFQEVRLARRRAPEVGMERECHLTASNMKAVAARLEQAHIKPLGTFTPEALARRLHVIGPELAEGFFADLAVLVEGVSDRAALYATAALHNIDFEAAGIAVLFAEGKTKIDKPAAIFTELGIPTYVVFDCDGAAEESGDADVNRALQRLMGEPNPFAAGCRVTANYACFERNLESRLKADLTAQIYDAEMDKAQAEHGLKRDDVLKTPTAMVEVLTGANLAGYQSQMLLEIVHAIVQKRNAF